MTRLRDRALLGTLAYVLIVIVVLVLPIDAPHVHRGYLREHRLPLGRRLLADVAVNIAIFAPIGWGLHRSARRREWLAPSTRLLAVAAIAGVFSLTMETVQYWLPGRYSSIVDVAFNTVGALVGAWTEAYLGRRFG